jgi:uncharacterized protein
MGAILRGEADATSELLSSGVDLNAINADGVTALMFAIGKGNVPIAEALIAGGADVHVKSKTGVTALLLAVGKGYDSLVESLIANGADIFALSEVFPKAERYAEAIRHRKRTVWDDAKEDL